MLFCNCIYVAFQLRHGTASNLPKKKCNCNLSNNLAIQFQNTIICNIQNKLDSNKQSVFLLYYRLILVVKYRNKVITTDIEDRLREIFEDIGKKYHIEVEERNFEPDHIHILFTTRPSHVLPIL